MKQSIHFCKTSNMVTLVKQTSLLNQVLLLILLVITSVISQDHPMVIENCNWSPSNYVSTRSKFTLKNPSVKGHDLSPNLTCQTRFYINEESYFLKVRVLKFDLQGPDDCTRNSEIVTFQIKGLPEIKWCGKMYAEELILPVIAVNLVYNTGIYDEGPGFEIEFSAVPYLSCYEQLNMKAATQPMLLYSPNYPGSYSSQVSCTVTLTAPKDHYIHIQSLVMDIENESNCNYDALIIDDVRYCGQRQVDVLVKSSSVMIQFKTDQNTELTGFVLKYLALPVEKLRCTSLVQNFTVNVSTVQSVVVLSGSSSRSQQCQVTLDTGSFNRTLDVTLPPDLQNIKNYTIVIDGETNSENGKLAITNSSGPRPYQTEGATTLNFLHSPGRQMVFSAALQGNSLILRVQSVAHAILPVSLTARYSLVWVSGIFTSRAPAVMLIRPEMLDKKSIEVGVIYSPLNYAAPISRHRVADYVDVYNGEDLSYFKMTSDCDGSRSAANATYSINTQNITVKVLRKYTSSGFWLYLGVSDKYYLPPPIPLPMSKAFKSEDFLYKNMKNLYCSWIVSDDAQRHLLQNGGIIEFKAQNNFNYGLTGNSFTVSGEGAVLLKYTAQTKDIWMYYMDPINITVSIFSTPANELPIYFNFNFYLQENMNNIQSPRCLSHQLEASETIQMISTPNYPNFFINYQCEWIIYNLQEPASSIVIQFPDLTYFQTSENTKIQIETSNNGRDFTLDSSLYSQVAFNGTYVEKFVKIEIVPTSRYMLPGFQFFFYSQVLPKNNDLTATETIKYLTSPNYPDSYPSWADFQWHITTEFSSSIVVVDVLDFNLGSDYSIQCTGGYVAVYDGPSTAYPRIKLLCGTIFSLQFNSTGTAMTIVFKPDLLNDYNRFKFKYRSHVKITPEDYGPNVVGIIFGVIAGGIVCTLFVVVLTIHALRRRRQRQRDNTPNRIPEPASGAREQVDRDHSSVFILRSTPVNDSSDPPAYRDVFNSPHSSDPPPYFSIVGNTSSALSANSSGYTGYSVHDLPPPYSPDLPGGVTHQVPAAEFSYPNVGSTVDSMGDAQQVTAPPEDDYVNLSNHFVGHETSENVYTEIDPRTDMMVAVDAPTLIIQPSIFSSESKQL